MADDEIDLAALEQQIADQVTGPQSTSFDGSSTSFRPLGEQLDALDRLRQRQAARQSPFGKPIKLNRGDALG